MQESSPPLPAGFLRHPVHVLALGFGAGCVPRLPGTMGTLVGVVIYILCRNLPAPWFIAGVVMMIAAGIWICGRTAADLAVHDHPAIVWDEIAGYLAAMAVAPQGWLWVIAGFFLFRLFDIWKPWPIAALDRKVPGGLGIMLDDLAAAAYTLIVIQIIAYLLVR